MNANELYPIVKPAIIVGICRQTGLVTSFIEHALDKTITRCNLSKLQQLSLQQLLPCLKVLPIFSSSILLSRFSFHFFRYGSSLLQIKTATTIPSITNQPYFSRNNRATKLIRIYCNITQFLFLHQSFVG